MPTLSISYKESNISLNDVQSIENLINYTLPVEYKNFITKNNGGVPNLKQVPLSNGEDFLSIWCFFPIKFGRGKVEDIINSLQVLESIIPKQYFPFANDGSGNLFCLKLDPKNYGEVYYIALDGTQHNPDSPLFVANSFEAFKNSLTDTTE